VAEAGYLDKLKDNQRAAVEFDVPGDALPPPSLVIAGPGRARRTPWPIVWRTCRSTAAIRVVSF